MPKFTKQQEQALNLDPKNYIVSASAGSGKTAVLTERVYRLISQGKVKNMSELLVLTFTNAAAASMREKIRKKLIENNMNDRANELDSANIQTFDAYALTLVKKYHYRLGLSKDTNIVDESVFQLIEAEFLNEIINERIKNDDNEIKLIYKRLVLRDDTDLLNLIKKVSRKAGEYTKGYRAYYDNYASKYFDRSLVDDAVNAALENFKKDLEYCKKTAKLIENTEDADNIIDFLDSVNADSYDSIHNFFSSESYVFPKAPKGSADDPNRKIIAGIFSKIKSHDFKDTKDYLIEEFNDNIELIKSILSISKQLNEKLDSFKTNTSSYSFNDIFRFANNIVDDDKICKSIKSQFKYIMIDEFQDTSELQDDFINKISNNNVYVVGDIKQSIYRFRDAKCELFLKRLNAYGDSSSKNGERIDLYHNFRSRRQVIDSINKLFIPLMTYKSTGLDYEKEHQMICGNVDYKMNETQGQNYDAEVIEYELPDKISKVEYEAKLIASDIINKINSGLMVYDDDLKRQRNIEPRDFAILKYAKTDFDVFQKVFNEMQVPLHAVFDETINENNLTRIVVNILNLIQLEHEQAYNEEYTHRFISIIRSFLYDYEDREEVIANIASSKNFDAYEAKKRLEEIAKCIGDLPVSAIVMMAFERFNIANKLYRIGDIRQNLKFLEYYVKQSKVLEKMNFSYKDFVNYFNNLDTNDIEVKVSTNENFKDSVQLMTIHNSKGLQYKYIYCPQLWKQIARMFPEKYSVTDKYGIIVPNYNKHPNGYMLFKTILDREEKQEEVLEKLRLFYVAVTRAEEKIIFVSKYSEKIKNTTIENAKTYQDFLNISMCDFSKYHLDVTTDLISQKDDGQKIDEKITIHSLNRMSNKFVEYKKASKNEVEDSDTILLEIGNKYHHYLELVDFNNKDTSFIKNTKDRERIDKFLNLSVFNNSKGAKVMHEYQFYDEENGVHGYIDLMLVYNDHVDIIDYKLSHVDDEAYEKQVGIYSSYIKRVTGLETHTYICGILSNKIKQVS